MKRSRSKPLVQEMNLTNLVDVVFAILIVFMISAPLMSQGVKVDLPKADAPTIKEEKLLKVSITKEREVSIADMKVELRDFKKIFTSIWDKKSPVVINADSAVDYGLIMKIVGYVQTTGVTQLGFLTIPPDEGK